MMMEMDGDGVDDDEFILYIPKSNFFMYGFSSSAPAPVCVRIGRGELFSVMQQSKY